MNSFIEASKELHKKNKYYGKASEYTNKASIKYQLTIPKAIAAADQIQPLFISVDPLRDTPVVLKEYLQHFDDRIVGLTGTTKQVAAVQRAYRIFAQKRYGGGQDSGDYLLDHTSISYMMGPNGEFKTFFSN